MRLDFKSAFRQLAKNRGFTAVVVLTLALGIGACTAIFSVVNGVLLQPLPFPHSDRLVMLRELAPPPAFGAQAEKKASPAAYLDWQDLAKSYDCLAASTNNSANFTGRGEPLRLNALEVTLRYFDVYGVKPALGRAFLPGEDAAGKNHVVVASHAFWLRALGGTAGILGQTIQLNNEPYTVVGVMPPGFGDETLADLWLPMVFTDSGPYTFFTARRSNRTYHGLDVAARLRPGVAAAQANAEINLIAAQLAERYPEADKGWRAFARPMLEERVGAVHLVLYTLLAAVGCVLLIACVNIANLLLARATARQRDMAIRAALGAGRWRLMRPLLIESLLLALLGGVAGVLLAGWGLDLLLAFAPSGLPRQDGIRISAGVLAFSFLLSIVTGILFGAGPAWLSARPDVNEALKQGSRGTTAGGHRGRLRGALVVLEVALALALLAAAGLFVRSFGRLDHVDPGYNPAHAATARLSLPEKKYQTAEQRRAFADAVLARLRALPDLQAASVTSNVPLSGFGDPYPFAVVGRRYPMGNSALPQTDYQSASPDYFRAAGIRLVRGRFFTDHDDAKAPDVAIINETFARQQFPNQDPLGQQIADSATAAKGAEIVGIVSDVAHYGVDQAIPCQLYYPFAQDPDDFFNLVVRTHGTAAAVLGSLRFAVSAVDPDQPINRVRTLDDMFAASIARPRFAMLLLTVFSGIALVIAAIGIYGVVAYAVSQRTTEIGIRMALGAQPADILRLIGGYGARLVGLGLAVGVAGAFAGGRVIGSMLFQTSGSDPLILSAVSILLGAVGALACLIPARRAARVDPLVALQAE